MDQPWLYQHLGFRGTSSELTRFAVRNLGFVSARAEKNYLRIIVRPDYFPLKAFEQIVCFLGRVEPKRIVIERDIDTPEFVDILTDPSDAVARLGELRVAAIAGAGTKFFADEMSVDRLQGNPHGVLAGAFRRWRSSRGRLSHRHVRAMFDNPLSAPWLVGSIERGGGLVTRTAPKYISFLDDDARSGLIGAAMTEHPDKEYGKAAERSYLAAHRGEKPVMELVTTIINPTARTTNWARYQRLILPWRLADGGRLLSSVSLVRVARDLASAAAT